MAKVRLDQLLVQRGLCETRAKAQARILAGDVLVDDRPVTKAGTGVAEDAPLRLRGEALPYVSRGGLKLAGGLEVFGVDPTGRICFDAGASTGGFTDCLLRQEATRVYAVDVGYGQLAWSLRTDPRVVVMERTNARHLESLPEPIDLCVIDASFISLRLLLEPLARLLGPTGRVLAMVKPQFEVGRARVGKGGVVRDDLLRAASADGVAQAAAAAGLAEVGRLDSVLPGPKGNREIFLLLARCSLSPDPASPCP